MRNDTELQIYRAVDTERQKWEKREERLLEQIALLQAQLRSETETFRNEELVEGQSQASDEHLQDREKPSRSLRTESPGQQARKTRVTFEDMSRERCDAEREAEKQTQEVRSGDLLQVLLAQ